MDNPLSLVLPAPLRALLRPEASAAARAERRRGASSDEPRRVPGEERAPEGPSMFASRRRREAREGELRLSSWAVPPF